VSAIVMLNGLFPRFQWPRATQNLLSFPDARQLQFGSPMMLLLSLATSLTSSGTFSEDRHHPPSLLLLSFLFQAAEGASNHVSDRHVPYYVCQRDHFETLSILLSTCPQNYFIVVMVYETVVVEETMKQQHVETRLLDNPFFFFQTSMDHDGNLPDEQKMITSAWKQGTSNTGRAPASSRRSQSIPLPSSHVHRTHSEVQLCEDMETAERRDLNMFYRLVNGIRERQAHLVVDSHQEDMFASSAGQHPSRRSRYYDSTHRHHPQYLGSSEAESCVAHIIHTRNTPMDTSSHPHHPHSNDHSASLPSNNSHSAMQASAALQALHQAASSDPDHHPEEELAPEGWSLSGFEEEQVVALADTQQSPFPPTDEDSHEDEDDGIFDLDL
jgi:hypothetical protein